MKQKDIDSNVRNAIRSLYAEDEGAKAFFDWAADRINDVAETSVERIAQVANLPRWQAVELGKALSEAECGDYVMGRRGWKSRIRWAFSLKSLGRAAKGEDVELEEVDPELAEDVSDVTAAAEPTTSRSLLTIADAKKMLAEAFGVAPAAIEITIRA